MSNCRFHITFLQNKQGSLLTFKFQWLEDEMWPYVDGDSKYVAGFQGSCFRCLGKRLRCGSQSLSISSTLTGFLHPRRQPQESGQELVDSTEKPVGCLASPS